MGEGQGRVEVFYMPLHTVVEWVPHSQVACGDRPIWAPCCKTNKQTPNRAEVKVRARR